MRVSFSILVLILALSIINVSAADAFELSGYVAIDGQVFISGPLYYRQRRDNVSLAIQPEFYHGWLSGSSFTFIPFARLDSADTERTHFDIRELNYLWLTDNWELRFGIRKVFWGVTETQHLVDIINQTDLVEHIDGEDKLGQPMIQLSVPSVSIYARIELEDWGSLENQP